MIKLFLLLVFLFVPQVGCFSQTKGITTVKPGISTESLDSWDFGNVKEGEVLQHTFIITNNAKAVLKITNVTTSCGCTASEIKKKELAPAESTSLEVKFNSKGYSGWAQQYIYVNTQSLENPILRFIIRANVIKVPVQKGQ